MNNINSPHKSVLFQESIEGLLLKPGDIAIDCTVGAGGHTKAMLAAVSERGLVIGIDRDPSAIKLVEAELADSIQSGRLKLFNACFSSLTDIARQENILGRVQGIFADIGVSSMHLDQAERGFSFQMNGPLDMRMNQTSGISAADLINEADPEQLTKMFYEFGEEPQAKKIVRRIVENRSHQKITTTSQLADIVKQSVHYDQKSKKHPATRVFQALRIAVNDELKELEDLLSSSLAALKPNGRLGVISFHSLEDRIIKNRFIDWSGKRQRDNLPRGIPFTESEIKQLERSFGQIIKPFPITPSDAEIKKNLRARSAKLRIFSKS